jgi:hypothetical protein
MIKNNHLKISRESFEKKFTYLQTNIQLIIFSKTLDCDNIASFKLLKIVNFGCYNLFDKWHACCYL